MKVAAVLVGYGRPDALPRLVDIAGDDLTEEAQGVLLIAASPSVSFDSETTDVLPSRTSRGPSNVLPFRQRST